jgi:hypothetical protein
MSDIQWSPAQTAIFEWFATGSGHLVVEARAGAAKTTTILEAINYAPEQRILLAAFNKRIATELATRLRNPNAVAKTLHGVGFACVMRYWGYVKVDDRRGDWLTDRACEAVDPTVDVPIKIKRLITKLHGKAREILPLATEVGDLTDLADTFECEPDEEWESVGFDTAFVEARALKAMVLAAADKPVATGIDFADMVFLPIRNRWMLPIYDMAVVDEVQDMTAAQLMLARGVCKGRLALVGDPKQCLYSFRGAALDGMAAMKEELHATDLRLSTTYRCGKAIVAHAQRLVPDFFAGENNHPGTVRRVPDVRQMTAEAAPGDFILSRKNAPLAGVAMSLIRANKRVVITGRDVGKGLEELARKLATGSAEHSIPMFLTKLANWEEKEIHRASKLKPESKAAQKIDAIQDKAETLQTLVDGIASVHELLTRLADLFSDTGNPATVTTCSTVHKCVSPDTFVETDGGLLPISAITQTALVATPTGPQYTAAIMRYPEAQLLRLATRSGYVLTATKNHGISVFGDEGLVRVEARSIRVRDWVRIHLGITVEPNYCPNLPPLPVGDVRSVRYPVPRAMTPELAELTGLMVADGTIFKGGFRVVKRYRSVCDRFAELVKELFSATAIHSSVPAVKGLTHHAEVDSVLLSRWLLTIGGMAPNAKAVPDVILRSNSETHAAFLRGLFEDGTVNTRGEGIDHLHLDLTTPSVLRFAQVALARLGIISALKIRPYISTLYIYSRSAKLFAERIGFVATEKNALLTNGTFATERHYAVPFSRAEVAWLLPHLQSKHDKGNIQTRRLLSRDTVRTLLDAIARPPEWLVDKLRWHYERIASITPVMSEAMCLEVPEGSRFFQNGIDGWNSKGLEADRVFVLMETMGIPRFIKNATSANHQEALNIEYVAYTRARHELVLVG